MTFKFKPCPLLTTCLSNALTIRTIAALLDTEYTAEKVATRLALSIPTSALLSQTKVTCHAQLGAAKDFLRITEFVTQDSLRRKFMNRAVNCGDHNRAGITFSVRRSDLAEAQIISQAWITTLVSEILPYHTEGLVTLESLSSSTRNLKMEESLILGISAILLVLTMNLGTKQRLRAKLNMKRKQLSPPSIEHDSGLLK